MMEIVNEAIIFAAKTHDGMRRKKSSLPYILHPMEAAVIVGSITDNPEVIAAAVLHDVVEDAGITFAEIEERFGKRVAELVASETEDKREHLSPESTWKLRKKEALEFLKETKDLDVKTLYLGDKLANIRSIYYDLEKEGDTFWQRFNQKDPTEHAWYYRSIAENISELSGTAAYREFIKLINKVFAEVS